MVNCTEQLIRDVREMATMLARVNPEVAFTFIEEVEHLITEEDNPHEFEAAVKLIIQSYEAFGQGP